MARPASESLVQAPSQIGTGHGSSVEDSDWRRRWLAPALDGRASGSIDRNKAARGHQSCNNIVGTGPAAWPEVPVV